MTVWGGCQRRVLLYSIFLSLLTFVAPVHANPGAQTACAEALVAPASSQEYLPKTIEALRERVGAYLKEVESETPRPGFADLARENKIEQVGVQGPRALQDYLSPHESFVSTPAPTSNDDLVVSSLDEGYSFPIHEDIEWHGRRTSTTVYASLPHVQPLNKGGYLIGPEYPVVVFHIHGGGTPTASGKNAMSIGENFVKRGIPVIAPDMPGHGRGTRALNGLTTIDEQVDWVLALINQLVDPRVKVVISGHSWGGMFALHMWLHSNEPKYERISRFISLSPGLDPTLGGDETKKIEFEQWYQANFKQFESKIAPTDYEFLSNLLVHGKVSDVSSYYTMLSDLDYVSRAVSPEEQKKLKPLMLIQGTADGLTYVGREHIFEEAFRDLQAPHQFILLGPGRTWQSQGPDDVFPTGHQVFDRYIDGTTTPEVYDRMAKAVEEVAAPTRPPQNEDKVQVLMDQLFRNEAKFLGFREFIRDHVEYAPVATSEMETFSKLKVDIDSYLKRIEARRQKMQKETDQKIRKATDDLRLEIGIKDQLTLERAEAELKLPPLTEERRQELETYLQKADAVEADLKANFQDPDGERAEAALQKEFQPLLTRLGIKNLSDYKTALDALAAKKDRSKQEEEARSQLSRLHQKYLEVIKQRQVRFMQERERRLSALNPPTGIQDPRMASRELNADRSADRQRKLATFVELYPGAVNAAKQAAEAAFEKEIAGEPKPGHAKTLEDVQRLKAELDARFSYMYEPPHNPEIQALVSRLAELNAERLAAMKGQNGDLSLDQMDRNLRELRGKITRLSKTWDAIWEKKTLNSPALEQAQAEIQRRLDHYAELYHAYEKNKSDWILGLRKSGQLNEQNLLAQPAELQSERQEVYRAKAAYESARDGMEGIRRREALAGHLQGPEADVQQATSAANTLWNQSGENLTAQLQQKESEYELRRRQEDILTQRRDELQWQYTQAMKQAGFKIPQDLQRYSIMELLNQPLDKLENFLRAHPAAYDALKATLDDWNTRIKELRSLGQGR